MQKSYLKKHFSFNTYSCFNKISLILLIFLFSLDGNSQTTIINPANEGGFEAGNTFALNGWSVTNVNVSNRNQWVLNTGATTGFSGVRCAYVTDNTAATPPPHSYTITAARVSHIYRNVTIPSGEADITLSFRWIGQGESTYDRMRVWVVPTSFNPVYGNQITTTGAAPTGRVQVGATDYSGQGTWTTASLKLPTAYAGTTVRLVFEWRNDGSVGTQPPAAIDNISLTSQIIVPPANDLCANATLLPCGTSNLAGTTVNSSNIANVSGCTMSNYGVWYRFVGDGQQTTISTNPGFDIKLSVSTGSCGALTNIVCTDTSPETATFTAVSGTTYYVYVGYWSTSGTTTGAFTISRDCFSPPSNDNCANATSVPVNPDNSCVSTVNSTTNGASQSQAGCTGTADDDVWFSFVATNTIHTVTVTPNTLNNAVVQFFTGTCASLTSFGCINSTTGSNAEVTTLTGLTPSTTYYYRVYSNANGSGQGTFSTCITTPTNPCSSITNIATCDTTVNISIPSGNGIIGTSSCGYSTPGNEIIYSFTPTTSGSYSINQLSSFSFIDYQFKVASLGCGTTGWTCIDDMIGTSVSPSFNLTAGTQYYFLLDPESSLGGDVSFSIACPPPPMTNDECINAISLTVNSSCTYSTYTTSGATSSSGIPAPGCASYSGGDVWFSAVVPANGILIIDTTQGAITDGGMAIYSGACGSLTLIECDDDDSDNGLMPYIQRTGLTPGSTIYIRFWNFGNYSSGTFGICVSTPSPPINDNPCGSIALTVNTTCAYQTYSTLGATATSGVTAPGCASYLGGDVWFNFVVPANGIVRIDSNTNQILDGGMAVYSGTCGSLTLVQCDNDSSTNGAMPYLSFTGLTPGTTLFIRFWEFGNDNNGTFNICVSTPCTPGSGNGSSSAGCPVVIVGELGLNGADPSPINSCGSTSCVDLEANYLTLGQTTNYSVESIPYNPPYQFGCLANPVSVNIDDVWSPLINLPFTFCYYGNTFTSCVMGSNGTLSFNTGNAGGYAGYSFSQNLPSTTGALFANTIYGVYHDIDPSKGGQVGWELITLSSGCRALVASWENVPMFSNNSILYTGMMVLYENTNIIEVYIKEKNIDNYNISPWNGGNAIVGLQNATSTQAVVAPGRNGLDTNWTTYNEAWRFVPSGPTLTSIEWHEGSGISGPLLGTSNTLTVCPSTTTTYTAQVQYTTCTGGIITVTDESVVTVNDGKIWNGSVDTDWNVDNNWTPVGIPNGSDCVLIPITPNNPIISGSGYNALAGTLTINTNATLNLNSNNNITVTDEITVQTNGNFIVNNNANLVQINNATNVGAITYHRDANIRSLDYVYWSSPVANQNINTLFNPITAGPKYEWNTTISNPNGGQGNWTNLGSSTMIPGKGYIIRGPSSSPFNNNSSNILTSNFIGVPNNGNIIVPIHRGSDTDTSYHTGTNGVEITNLSDNWNLLGNPYPSSIRGSQFLFNNKTKIEGNIRLWTHGTLPSNVVNNPFYSSFIYNYTPGDYITFNFTGSSCCPTAGLDLFIGAGQSFFVQMLDGPAATDVVTFNNGLRSSGYPNNNFYRLQNASQFNAGVNINNIERNRIWLDIINSNNQSSRTLFGYIEGATSEWDTFFDCLTQVNGSMDIFSLANTKKLSIQGKPLPFVDEDSVPIGVSVYSNGDYSIGLAGFDGIFESQSIYLKDKLLGIVHDLKVEPYHFAISSGVHIDRFEIVYRNNSLSINDNSFNHDLKVIVNNQVTVQSSTIIKEITVYNAIGQKIDNYYSNKTEVLLSSLTKSHKTLLLKIKLDNGEVYNKKIIF